MTERNAGLRGRLPQREDGNRFAIKWAHEYRALETPSYPLDISQGITDWGMLGNDTYGNCGPCGVAHERMLAGAKPTTQEVEALYLQYTGGQDVGVVIADFLLWLFQQKLIEGFAPVERTNVDAIMETFKRGVILGVSLTDDANSLFNQGLPWTVSHGEQPDPREGHVILKVQASAATSNGIAVTWGANQEIEYAWQQACIDEAWVIVTKDDMGDAAYAALEADLLALPNAQGNEPPVPEPVPPSPVPPPEPPPVPIPDPTPPPIPDPVPPTPDIHGFVEQVRAIVRKAVDEIEDAAVTIIRAVEGP